MNLNTVEIHYLFALRTSIEYLKEEITHKKSNINKTHKPLTWRLTDDAHSHSLFDASPDLPLNLDIGMVVNDE